jgi:CheY-like chemotaxis protein/signal transduction histidine kinase
MNQRDQPKAGVPSPEFTRLVRSALAHFYDYAYLQNHPLGLMLDAQGESDRMTRAQRLRRALLECVEALKPEQQDRRQAEAARAYAILTYRYVDGLSMHEIAKELALSRQQVYREHEKGMMAIASLLWDRVRAAAEPVLLAGSVIQDDEGDRLKMAQAEADRLWKASHTELLDFQDLLEGICKLLTPVAQGKGIQIRMSLPDARPLLAADRVLVRQALLNLLTYALDVVQGDLGIAVSHGEKGLLIEINEAANAVGKGAGSSPVPQRAGVGLRVAQRLIETQGGQLETRIQEGEWAARVLWPTASKAILLVIDDNADIVALFRRYLAGYGVSIIGATDGRQALNLAVALQPQAITLDVMIPHQDGWEILQRLKESPATKHIPVIVCSILNEPQLAFSMGADDYVTKPVSQAALLEALQRCLGPLQMVA